MTADLDSPTYALDSGTIDLCLSLFPRATFLKSKAVVKMHKLLDLRGSTPSFIRVSEGKLHDVNVLDLLVPEPGATCLMDRAHVDFRRLYKPHQAPCYRSCRSCRSNKLSSTRHLRRKRRKQHRPPTWLSYCCSQPSLGRAAGSPQHASPLRDGRQRSCPTLSATVQPLPSQRFLLFSLFMDSTRYSRLILLGMRRAR